MERLSWIVHTKSPLNRAWQQGVTLVENSREREFPVLATRAKHEGAMIFFVDESGIRSDGHSGAT